VVSDRPFCVFLWVLWQKLLLPEVNKVGITGSDMLENCFFSRHHKMALLMLDALLRCHWRCGARCCCACGNWTRS
jgi:hypothetical protein